MEEITALVNPEHIEALVEGASRFGFQIVTASAVFVVGRWLARRLADLLERGLVRAKTDPTLVSFFRNIVYFGLLVMVIIAAVGQVGVQTTSFIAVLGAAGLAVGLALVFGVSYGDDLDEVKRVIGEVLAEEKRLLKDPEPLIGLLSLGDSSVDFAVRPWVRSSEYWPVFFDLQEAMKKRFDKEGISIPFPQRDVHLYQQAS